MSLEAELSVLGALMVSNACLADVSTILRQEDFALPDNRVIYSAIVGLIRGGQKADMITVAESLRNQGVCDAVGGIAHLGALTLDVYTTSNVADHARLVREHADRRRLIEAAESVIRNARSESSEQMRSRMLIAAQQVETGAQTVMSMSDAVDAAYKRMEATEARYKAGGIGGVPTGIASLDQITGGFADGQVWVIAARPGTGKSALLGKIAVTAGKHGLPGLIFSLEMGADEIAIRAIASESGQNVGRLFRGFRNERETAAEHAANLMRLPVSIDASTRTLDGIVGRIVSMRAKGQIAWVAIDHIGLIAQRNSKSRNDHIGEITSTMKGLALAQKMPVILLSQMSRGAEKEDRKPMLSDLRDSGNIEQDADGVLFLHRQSQPNEQGATPIEIGILKNRSGRCGFWMKEPIEFDGTTQTFRELTPPPPRGFAAPSWHEQDAA